LRPPLQRLLAGCIALGLLAVPGLSRADDAAAPATKTAPKPKSKSTAKAKSAAGKVVPRTKGAADLLLPQPEPMDAGLAVTKGGAPKSSAASRGSAAGKVDTPQFAAVPLPPSRPPELAGRSSATEEELQTASIPVSGPLGVRVSAETLTAPAPGTTPVDELISKHAARYGLPESLLRRVVKRESGGNPRLRHGPYIGLMQMRLDTARGMGYSGSAEGLLDADTSLTYGAAYLANAWRVSGGNQDRAVSLYSSGYYYEAKRKGMLPKLIKGKPGR